MKFSSADMQAIAPSLREIKDQYFRRYIGVLPSITNGKLVFIAQLSVDGKSVSAGRIAYSGDAEEDARKAALLYDNKAIEIFGKDTKLNFTFPEMPKEDVD